MSDHELRSQSTDSYETHSPTTIRNFAKKQRLDKLLSFPRLINCKRSSLPLKKRRQKDDASNLISMRLAKARFVTQEGVLWAPNRQPLTCLGPTTREHELHGVNPPSLAFWPTQFATGRLVRLTAVTAVVIISSESRHTDIRFTMFRVACRCRRSYRFVTRASLRLSRSCTSSMATPCGNRSVLCNFEKNEAK